MEYDRLPWHIKRHLAVQRDEYNSLSTTVRSILIDTAQHLAMHEAQQPRVEVDADIHDWSWKGVYHDKKVGRNKFEEYEYIGTLKTPFIITGENMYDFYRQLDDIAAASAPDEIWDAYQITLNTSLGYINSSPGSLLNAIQSRAETYDDQVLFIFDVVIRYTAPEDRMNAILESIKYLYAGQGEGLPIQLDGGFWLIDGARSKHLCIVNCYTVWSYYRKGHLPDTQTLASERKKINRDTGDVSIHDLPPHPYTVLFNESDVVKLSPKETLSKCHYYYKNGHMYMIAHEDYLHNDIATVRKQANRTFLSKIPNKNAYKIPLKDIHVMDIESHRKDLGDHTVRHDAMIVGHLHKNKYRYFRGEKCLTHYFQWLRKKHQDLIVWAHNGGKYDFHVLLKAALDTCDNKRKRPIELLDVEGRFIEMTVYFDTGCKLTFRDSYALIPASLKKLGVEFGVQEKMDDVDIVNVTRDQLLNDPIYLEYNRQDCVSLYDILLVYQRLGLEAHGTDPLYHPSASSYAKRIFYSKYYKPNQYPLYELPRSVHKYVEKAYGGGRCEVFYRGIYKGVLHYYDINSSYPYAGTLPLPYGKPKYHSQLLTVTDVNNFLTKHPGFYQVKVSRNGIGKPLHGIMTKGKYIFPRFDDHSPTIYCYSKELEYGLSLGYEYQLIDGYEFRLANWGKDFFEAIYYQKLQAEHDGHNGLRWVYKITGNSGYGFFGFSKYDRNITKIYGRSMHEHVENLSIQGQCEYHVYENDTIVSYETSDILLNDVNIAAAAAITSYGRIHLHRLVHAVEQHGGKVLYCDTDSLVTDLSLEKISEFSTMLSDKLGDLKNELRSNDHITEAVFVSCKLYGYKTKHNDIKTHAKGVREKSDDLFNKLTAMLTEPQEFIVPQMMTGRMKKAKGDLDVYDTLISKVLSGSYSKRRINSDGSTTAYIHQ